MDPVCEWRVHGCTKVPEYVIANPENPSALHFEVCCNCADWFNPDWTTLRDKWPTPLHPLAPSVTLTPREAMVLLAIVGWEGVRSLTPQLLAEAVSVPLANVRVLLAGLAARGMVVDNAVGLYLTDAGRRAVDAYGTSAGRRAVDA